MYSIIRLYILEHLRSNCFCVNDVPALVFAGTVGEITVIRKLPPDPESMPDLLPSIGREIENIHSEEHTRH